MRASLVVPSRAKSMPHRSAARRVPGSSQALLVAIALTTAAGCGEDEPVGGSASGGEGGSGGAGASAGSGGAAGAGGKGPLLEGDCDPIGAYCGLPFPSDVYLRSDPTGRNPSGRSVRFGAATLPKVMGTTPIAPDDYHELDGWSVASSPTTFLAGATSTGLANPTTIASSVSTDSPTIWLDTKTGELVPHWVDVDESTSGPDKALMLRPGVVLDYATRYIVAIRRVVDEVGVDVAPTDVFRALRDGAEHDDPSVQSRRAHYAEIFDRLAAAGVPKDDLQIAWDFTTGSRESITGGMIAVRDAALAAVGAQGPEFIVASVEDDPNPMIKHRVILSATVPRYLTTHEYSAGDPVPRLMFDEAGVPVQNGTMDMEVLVQIPNSIDNGQPHGILQNGHGFLGSKTEGSDGYQARAADGWSWVTVAVDLFGASTPSNDFQIAAEALLGRAELLPGFVDRQIQGHVNQLLAMRMMLGRVATSGITDDAGRMLLDPAAIDPGIRAYRGDSQGGVMGSTYMSITTDVTRGLIGEAGIGFSMIWQRSINNDPFTVLIRPTLPNSPLDFQILLQLIQLHWDRSEPAGFVRSMSGDTFPGTPDHRVVLHTGIGDHEVPTVLSHVLARTLGAKLIRSDDPAAPYPRAVFGLDEVDAPFSEGSGLIEYDFNLPPEPLGNVPATGGCNPHDRVRELTPSFEQQDRFFRTGRIEWTCDGVCNCDDGVREEEGCAESFQKECN